MLRAPSKEVKQQWLTKKAETKIDLLLNIEDNMQLNFLQHKLAIRVNGPTTKDVDLKEIMRQFRFVHSHIVAFFFFPDTHENGFFMHLTTMIAYKTALHTKTLKIGKVSYSMEPAFESTAEDDCTVWVGNIPSYFNSQQLATCLRNCEPAFPAFESCTVPVDRQTNTLRPFGFIKFSNSTLANYVIATRNPETKSPIIVNGTPFFFDYKRRSQGVWKAQEKVAEVRNGVRFPAPAGAVKRPTTSTSTPQRIFITQPNSQIVPYNNATFNMQVVSLEQKVSDVAVTLKKSSQDLVNTTMLKINNLITDKVKEAVKEQAEETEAKIFNISQNIKDQSFRLKKIDITQKQMQKVTNQQQHVLAKMFTYFKV